MKEDIFDKLAYIIFSHLWSWCPTITTRRRAENSIFRFENPINGNCETHLMVNKVLTLVLLSCL